METAPQTSVDPVYPLVASALRCGPETHTRLAGERLPCRDRPLSPSCDADYHEPDRSVVNLGQTSVPVTLRDRRTSMFHLCSQHIALQTR